VRQQAASGIRAGPRAADPLRTRRFFLAGLAVGIIAMSATGLAMVSLITSPGQVAAESAAPPRSVITAVARWEVLRDAIAMSGVVRAARTVTVTASAPYSTVTVTRMPVKAGDRVWPGRVIAEIDGRPVVLLRGRLPAYRDLHEGDSGPDVAQLQSDLEGLGYADYDPRGYFGPSTSLALLLFYRHLGYQAPAYHPARAGRGRPGTGAGQQAGQRTGRLRAAVPGLPDVYLPRSEVTYIPARSALVVTVDARVGTAVGGGPVLSLATGHPYVTGTLSAHQASLVRRGDLAQLASASPALIAAGTVTRIGTMPAVGGPPPGGYPVRVRSRRPLPQRLVGARIRLTLWTPVTAGPVLTVPLTTVFGARRGAPGYVIVTGRGGRRERVPVFTGPSAGGLIAVQPVRTGALRPGDRLLVGTGS